MYYDELPDTESTAEVRSQLMTVRDIASSISQPADINHFTCHMASTEQLHQVNESVNMQERIRRACESWRSISHVIKTITGGLTAITGFLPPKIKTYAVIATSVMVAAVTIGDLIANSVLLDDINASV